MPPNRAPKSRAPRIDRLAAFRRRLGPDALQTLDRPGPTPTGPRASRAPPVVGHSSRWNTLYRL